MTEEDIGYVQAWFQSLKDVIEEHGIQPHDIWTMGEIGFRTTGAAMNQIEVTRQNRGAKIATPMNRQLGTLVEVISAVGEILPLFLVLPGKWHMSEWYEVEQLDGQSALGVSETGCLNDELRLGWLEHFDKHSRAKARGKTRLLLLDGIASDLTVNFIQYCYDHDIIPFGLVPGAAHFLQPLDYVEFEPMKHFRGRMTKITKVDFLEVIEDIRKEDLKEDILKAAFTKTGIRPLNPEVVLAEVRRKIEPRTPPQSPRAAAEEPYSSPFGTPTTPGKLERVAERILEACEELVGNPDSKQGYKRAFERFARGAMIQATELSIWNHMKNSPDIIAEDGLPLDNDVPEEAASGVERESPPLTEAAKYERERKALLRSQRAQKRTWEEVAGAAGEAGLGGRPSKSSRSRS